MTRPITIILLVAIAAPTQTQLNSDPFTAEKQAKQAKAEYLARLSDDCPQSKLDLVQSWAEELVEKASADNYIPKSMTMRELDSRIKTIMACINFSGFAEADKHPDRPLAQTNPVILSYQLQGYGAMEAYESERYARLMRVLTPAQLHHLYKEK